MEFSVRRLDNQQGLARVEGILFLAVASFCAHLLFPEIQLILSYLEEGNSLLAAFFLLTDKMSYVRLGFLSVTGVLSLVLVYFCCLEVSGLLGHVCRNIYRKFKGR